MDLNDISEIIRQVDIFYKKEKDGKLNHTLIKELVIKRINDVTNNTSILPESDKWRLFTSSISAKVEYEFDNFNYLQFPSFICEFSQKTSFGNYFENKTFTICLSLLVPYYTYYYGVGIRAHIKGDQERPDMYPSFGIHRSNSFSKSPEFKLIIDEQQIINEFENHFNEIKYVPYTALEWNLVTGLLPYGKDYFKSKNDESSIYQLMFDPNHKDQWINIDPF
ncbi:hypothetical protein [Fulvivirga sp.]|uniref:hypothetical protein n=1 Tax=Fulvivirga sp. TaxID=1931237 RepID=UPI0032ED442C